MDLNGFSRGLAAAAHPGGLTHQAFAARTLVLMGEMTGNEVGPFLSGLLIGTEIAAGLSLIAGDDEIIIVADDSIGASYTQAFTAHGRTCQIQSPERCFIAGLNRILSAMPAPGV